VDTTYCEVNFSLEVTTGDCITTGGVLTNASEGIEYSTQLVAASPEAGQVWSISAGALPSGVAIIAGTGEITGTPGMSSAGFYAFTVKLTNLDTSFCEKAFQLTVTEAGGGCSGMPPTPDLATWSTVILSPGSTISFDGVTGNASMTSTVASQAAARKSTKICRALTTGDLAYTVTWDYTIAGAPFLLLPWFDPHVELIISVDDIPVDSDISGTVSDGSTGTLSVTANIPDDQALHNVRVTLIWLALPDDDEVSTTASGPISGSYV
jgi:hypothetical protein